MSESFTQELAFGPWLSGILLELTTGLRRRAIIKSGTVVVTLQPISLSGFSGTFTIGTPASGNLIGWSLGSTISQTSVPAGVTIDTTAHTWAWSGAGTTATSSFTLTETLAGATNTPNPSVINYIIAAAAVNRALKFNAAANSQYVPVLAL